MSLQVGYGLEGVLPDSIAKRITEDVIKPFFQRNDFDGGLTAGVNAILQAARGEYQGTGQTARSRQRSSGKPSPSFIILFVFFLIVLASFRRRGTMYHRRRRSYWGGWPAAGWTGGSWGGGGSGGGWSGGGFSGGGGSFGGGGAGSSW